MKCIVKGCENSDKDGQFVRDLCVPCYHALKTGKAEHGTSWIFTQSARISGLEFARKTLTEHLAAQRERIVSLEQEMIQIRKTCTGELGCKGYQSTSKGGE